MDACSSALSEMIRPPRRLPLTQKCDVRAMAKMNDQSHSAGEEPDYRAASGARRVTSRAIPSAARITSSTLSQSI